MASPEPVLWFASPNEEATPGSEYARTAFDAKKALEMLQDADRTMTRRLEDLDQQNLDEWPGYQLRIYVEDGGELLAADREVHRLMLRLTRYGLRAGVRLEVQW